jgi:hypothetical protein
MGNWSWTSCQEGGKFTNWIWWIQLTQPKYLQWLGETQNWAWDDGSWLHQDGTI